MVIFLIKKSCTVNFLFKWLCIDDTTVLVSETAGTLLTYQSKMQKWWRVLIHSFVGGGVGSCSILNLNEWKQTCNTPCWCPLALSWGGARELTTSAEKLWGSSYGERRDIQTAIEVYLPAFESFWYIMSGELRWVPSYGALREPHVPNLSKKQQLNVIEEEACVQ